MIIEDGTGHGYLAKVNKQNQILSKAVSLTEEQEIVNNSNAYIIDSGIITLTSDNESGIIYIKNNEELPLQIGQINISLSPSTNGTTTDITTIKLYKNPTTGSLISNAIDVDIISNRHFSSGKTLTIDAYKGVEGDTITDGTVHSNKLLTPGNILQISSFEILTKGNSLAISIEPNTSNTSMKVSILMHVYLLPEDAK